jgi:hypothetical protein
MIDPGRNMKRLHSEASLLFSPIARAIRVSILVGVALSLGLGLAGAAVAGDKYQKMINCDLHKGACTQLLDGHKVTLTVTPRPVKAMADLAFEVAFEDDPGGEAAPYIDLGMPGMNMGKNRVVLEPEKPGMYKGTGVIVRCKSGRRTWRATVTIPGMGSADFVFDVIY